jgi:hypothetical protein
MVCFLIFILFFQDLFVRHPKSFEECLECAVLNGGDRDTMGAMACALYQVPFLALTGSLSHG